MKKFFRIMLLGFFVITYGCSEDDALDNEDLSFSMQNGGSFLPMQIGNYWKINDENFIEIIDTLRLQGDLYYKFYSLIGGDAISTQYLRIDDNQNLIESYPEYPYSKYLHAKFNAQIGSTFWTRNDQSYNDLKVAVLEKEDSLRTFEFQTVYHPNATGKYKVTYIKGLGWNNYNEIKINGNIFHF